MANPTKVAQNVWTTEAHRDFLQLIEENSGRIFSWIDYQGFLQGNFLTGSGGGSGIGGVSVHTANYTANAGDAGTLLVFDSATAVMLNLPANAPNKWNVFFLNIGSGALIVSPNGNLLNGFSSSFTFTNNQGGIVFSDNTNYFLIQCGSSSGGSGGGTDFSLPFPLLGTVDGVNTTFTLPTAPTGSVAITLGGLVQEEGVDFTVAGLTVAFNPLAPPTQTPIAYFGVSGGGGSAGVVATLNLTAQTGTIPTSLLYTTGPFTDGVYRVSVDMICTTAGAAGGVSVAIGWNNGVTLSGLVSNSMSLSTPGESLPLSGTFYSGPSQNITYTTTVTGGAGSAYALRIRLEYLS